jgi:uncharacterized repeat protein (TIGR04076 family)
MLSSKFNLYKLKITLRHTKDNRQAYSIQPDGSYFFMSGENLVFSGNVNSVPLYALAALMPLLPAKQRPTDPVDWITTDCVVADPDPHSGIEYHIERLELETFERSSVTATKVKEKNNV